MFMNMLICMMFDSGSERPSRIKPEKQNVDDSVHSPFKAKVGDGLHICPLQSGLRPPRARIGDAVAPRNGREYPKAQEKATAWRINGAQPAIGECDSTDGRPSGQSEPTASCDYTPQFVIVGNNAIALTTRDRLVSDSGRMTGKQQGTEI